MKFLRRSPTVAIGDRFAPAQLSTFGRIRDDVWAVSRLFDGPDRVSYARLEAVHDSSRSKTVAVSALIDTHLFRLVARAAG